MPRIKPVYNFAKSVCVHGLNPLPAEMESHAQRVHVKGNPRQGYSHEPRHASKSHTSTIIGNTKFTGKLTFSRAEQKLIEELGKI